MDKINKTVPFNLYDNSSLLREQHVIEYYDCTSFDFFFNTILIGILSLFGILGNTLSILVLQKDQNNRVAAFLLQSLAVSDSLVLLTSLLVLSIIYGLLPFIHYSHIARMCIPYIVKYIHPIGYMVKCATIWITVLLAINRYIAIVKPFLAPKLCTLNKARVQVLTVSVLAFVFNFPRFFQYEIIENFTPPGKNKTITAVNDTLIGEYSLFGVVYTNMIYTFLVLIVPLFILLILNTWLIYELKFSGKKSSSSLSSSQLSINNTNVIQTFQPQRKQSLCPPLPEEDNITLIMVAIIVIFLLCHTPDRIFHIIRYFFATYDQLACGKPLYYMSSMCNLLIVINSSTNFIIYYMMRKRFRKILVMKICAWSRFEKYREKPSYLEPHRVGPPPLLRRHTDSLIGNIGIDKNVQIDDVKKVKLLIKTGSAPVLL